MPDESLDKFTLLRHLKMVMEAIKAEGYLNETETRALIKELVPSAIIPSGSISFSELPTPSNSILGNLYNITDAFVTTDIFLEGAGHGYPEGTNVMVVLSNGEYKYDIMAGFIDTSNFVTKDEATIVTASSINGNIIINNVETPVAISATDEEVQNVINNIFTA